MSQEEPMVGASEAIRKLNIPRTSFYRAVEDGKIPSYDEIKPWGRRRVTKRFKLSEVRKALGLPAEPPTDRPS